MYNCRSWITTTTIEANSNMALARLFGGPLKGKRRIMNAYKDTDYKSLYDNSPDQRSGSKRNVSGYCGLHD